MKVRELIRLLRNRVSTLWIANAAESDAVNEFLAVVNESKHGQDGWVQLSPYGDFDNSQGMQRIRREDGDAMVEAFHSLSNSVARTVGLPWYIGHPDHPSGQGRYLDTKAYGRIKDLETRDDGIYAKVKWSPRGKEMINEEMFHGHSTNWKVRKEGNCWRPFLLKSVGFTNEPNIPVRPIMVANENQNTPMLKKIIALLNLKAEATETDVESAIQGLVNEKKIEVPNWLATLMGKQNPSRQEAETFINEAMASKDPLATCNSELADWKKKHGVAANEASTAKTELVTANGKITTLTNERDTLQQKVTTAETNFANERKRSIRVLVDTAILRGSITAAEKAQWETDLANEASFETKVDQITKLPPKLHTSSMVNSGRNREVIDRNTQIAELVNEEMKKGSDYDSAWAKIKKDHKGLFDQMQQPEHAKAK